MTTFKVGDKVRVVSQSFGWAKVCKGDKGTIQKINGNRFELNIPQYPKCIKWSCREKDIELIETKPTKKQRITALEETVATLTQQVQNMQAQIDEMLQQSKSSVEKSAYGFEKPSEVTGEIGAERTRVSQLTLNEQRKLIIEKAKRFATDALSRNHLGSRVFKGFQFTQKHKCEFVVNPEKRTVVALVKETGSKGLYARSITKCHVDDVFNEHIGKAIALGRALGLDVREFTEVVQPNEVTIGTYIHCFRNNEFQFEHTVQDEDDADYVNAEIRDENNPWKHNIINDTNAQY